MDLITTEASSVVEAPSVSIIPSEKRRNSSAVCLDEDQASQTEQDEQLQNDVNGSPQHQNTETFTDKSTPPTLRVAEYAPKRGEPQNSASQATITKCSAPTNTLPTYETKINESVTSNNRKKNIAAFNADPEIQEAHETEPDEPGEEADDFETIREKFGLDEDTETTGKLCYKKIESTYIEK